MWYGVRNIDARCLSQVLQDVLRRMKKAYDNFFRRVKAGKTPGYPRFQGYGRYDSFTFPQSGFSLTEDNRVCLSKIGTLKVKFPTGKKANPPTGTMKTCTVKREGEHWSIVFTCEVEPAVVSHRSSEAVGMTSDSCTLRRSQMEARLRTRAICVKPNKSSRNCKRHGLAKSGDQSAGEKPLGELERLTGIFGAREKIFTTKKPVSW